MNPNVIRQSLHLQGFDPERLAEIIRGARFEHYILTRSRCEVRHQRWACGSFSIDIAHYSFPVRVVGSFPQKRLCIGYMRTLTGPTWVNGFEFGTDALQFYPPGCELNYRAASNGQWVAIEFEEAALQRVARERLGIELQRPRNGAANFDVPRTQLRELDRVIQRSLRKPETAVSMIEPILGTIAELVAHAQTGTLASLARRWQHRAELLSRADHYLQLSAGVPFDLKALAAAVGATERSLQMHFHDAYGITPGHWARTLALHRVRDRLRKTDARKFTVEGMAQECGFRHMGRFSAYYKELFGEFPSMTLARTLA
jgi:AraC family transcriptional regulator, ethanolamine operon transcriptional activator